MLEKFPFRVHTVRTDRGHEWQALFLTYSDDVDLSKKLAAWEDFYKLHRPHGAHEGQTPYEALKRLLVQPKSVSVG